MGHKKKRKNLFKAAMPGRVQAEALPEGRETMNQDAFHPEPAADPQDGVAVIPEVTPEMMDDVAHRAAELADGVAHHTHAYDAPVHDHDAPAQAGAPVADETVTEAAKAAEVAVGPVVEILTEASEEAQAVLAEADDVATRAADAAGSGFSAASDAFGQYNAKVFEMVRSNMASTTALFAALVQAKSVPEAVALNADHLRRQVETLTAQGRELASLAQKLALDALKPLTRTDH